MLLGASFNKQQNQRGQKETGVILSDKPFGAEVPVLVFFCLHKCTPCKNLNSNLK